MSINGTHIMPPAGPVSPEILNAGMFETENAGTSKLSQHTATAAFSSIIPGIQTVFTPAEVSHGQASDPSNRIVELLSNNITLLQESFMDMFHEKLQNLGVDSTLKLSLRLNDEAKLVVAGEHPDKTAIDELLATDPDLAETFVEIAAQSAALRDLRSLRTLTLYDRASDAYSALAAGPGECIYQLSLKGEMNHFYFTR